MSEEKEVGSTILEKSIGINSNQNGNLRAKIEFKGTNFEKSEVPKPVYSDGGLKPARCDDSTSLGIKSAGEYSLVSKNKLCSTQEVATVAIGETADDYTLVEITAGGEPSLDLEMKVPAQPGDTPELGSENREYLKENYLFQAITNPTIR